MLFHLAFVEDTPVRANSRRKNKHSGRLLEFNALALGWTHMWIKIAITVIITSITRTYLHVKQNKLNSRAYSQHWIKFFWLLNLRSILKYPWVKNLRVFFKKCLCIQILTIENFNSFGFLGAPSTSFCIYLSGAITSRGSIPKRLQFFIWISSFVSSNQSD